MKLYFHRLARCQIRKTPHKKECVRIFDGNKRTQDFHSDFSVRRNTFGAKYFEESRPHTRLRFIGAHFDNHLDNLRRSGYSSPVTFGTYKSAPLRRQLLFRCLAFDTPNRYSHLAFAGGVSWLTRKAVDQGDVAKQGIKLTGKL